MPLFPRSTPYGQKLRFIGQIVVVGSLGTASSAIVYLLQDQIRQIQRLKHALDHHKRFVDTLRKHGFTEAHIQRLRGLPLEDDLLDQEKRGLITLELVHDPPKWTNSPHKGQMYHIVPSQPRHATEPAPRRPHHTHRRRRIILNPDAQPSSQNPHPNPSGSSSSPGSHEAVSSSPPHATTANWSVFASPIQYVHAFTRRWRCAPSFSSSNLMPQRHVLRFPLPFQVQTAISAMTFSTFRRERSPKFRHQTPTDESSPTVLTALSAVTPGSPDFEFCLETLQSLIETRNYELDYVFEHLVQQGSFVHALALFEKLDHSVVWTPSAMSSLLRALAFTAHSQDSEPLRPKLSGICHALLSHLTPAHADSLLHEMASLQIPIASLVAVACGPLLSSYSHLLPIFINHFKLVVPNQQLASQILLVLDHIPQLSEFTIFQVADSLILLGLDDTSAFMTALLLSSVRHQLPFAALELHRLYPALIPRDPSTGVPQALALAVDSASNANVSLTDEASHKLIQYFEATPIPETSKTLLVLYLQLAALPSIGTTECRQILQTASAHLDYHHFSTLLVRLPVAAEQRLVHDIQGWQQAHLSKIGNAQLTHAQRESIFNSFIDWHQRVHLDPFELYNSWMIMSMAQGRHADAARAAWTLFQNYPHVLREQHFIFPIMAAFAARGQINHLNLVLERLESTGQHDLLRHSDEFWPVFYHLSTRASPDHALGFISHCADKYHVSFGPRTFDQLLKRAFNLGTMEQCLSHIKKLLHLSAQMPFNVGVRRNSIFEAFMGCRKFGPLDQSLIYFMFSKVCSVNEALLSTNLLDYALIRFSTSAMDYARADNRPRMFGRHWSAAFYHQLRRNRVDITSFIMEQVRLRSSSLSPSRCPISCAFQKETKWRAPSRYDDPSFSSDLAVALGKDDSETLLQKLDDRLSPFVASNVENTRLGDDNFIRGIAAALRQGNDAMAQTLAERAKESGVSDAHIQYRLLKHKIWSDPTLKMAEIEDVVLAWYATHGDDLLRGILNGNRAYREMYHGLLRVAVRALIHSRQYPDYDSALELLHKVAASKWAKAHPFGIREIMLYFPSYSARLNLEGLIEVVNIVLKKDWFVDAEFIRELFTAHRIALHSAKFFNNGEERLLVKSVFAELQSRCLTKAKEQKKRFQHFVNQVFDLLLGAPHPDVDDNIRKSGHGGDLKVPVEWRNPIGDIPVAWRDPMLKLQRRNPIEDSPVASRDPILKLRQYEVNSGESLRDVDVQPRQRGHPHEMEDQSQDREYQSHEGVQDVEENQDDDDDESTRPRTVPI